MSTRKKPSLSQAPSLIKPAFHADGQGLFASRINRGMKVDLADEVIIVTPNDALEALRYDQFHLEVGRISDLLRHHEFPHLVIDLSESLKIDSILLTALTGFCRTASTAAAFCSVPAEIRRSRRTMSLLNRWPIYASRSDAIEAMSQLNRQ